MQKYHMYFISILLNIGLIHLSELLHSIDLDSSQKNQPKKF